MLSLKESLTKIEKDGVDAFSARFHLGQFTDLHLVVNPENKGRKVNLCARFRTNVSEFDISVMGGQFDGRVLNACTTNIEHFFDPKRPGPVQHRERNHPSRKE